MPLKLFISGKYTDHETIHQKIEDLQNTRDFIITHDWTQVEQSDRSYDAFGKYAELDINGVLDANVHVIEMNDPTYPYRGTFTEIGCALGQNIEIILICPFLNAEKGIGYCRSNVFFWHPKITRVTTWNEAEELLKLYSNLS